MVHPIGPSKPSLEVVEQPKSRCRFRYECEGRYAGSIPGRNYTEENKCYPTIRLVDAVGPAVIVVSCVTSESRRQRPHPHNLVGKNCKDGVCTLKVRTGESFVSFPNLGIQCVKKRDIAESLEKRQKLRVDPFQTGFVHAKDLNSINLNEIRIAFQAFLPNGEGRYNVIVPPVVTEPILDRKSNPELVITRIGRHHGPARGCGREEEIILLCEKVKKDEIEIVFTEYDKENFPVWEQKGRFTERDVHHQVAIVFRSPPYKDQLIRDPVDVYITLRKKKDLSTSESMQYKWSYVPNDSYEDEQLRRKRQKLLHDVEPTGGFPPTFYRTKLVGRRHRASSSDEPTSPDTAGMGSLTLEDVGLPIVDEGEALYMPEIRRLQGHLKTEATASVGPTASGYAQLCSDDEFATRPLFNPPNVGASTEYASLSYIPAFPEPIVTQNPVALSPIGEADFDGDPLLAQGIGLSTEMLSSGDLGLMSQPPQQQQSAGNFGAAGYAVPTTTSAVLLDSASFQGLLDAGFFGATAANFASGGSAAEGDGNSSEGARVGKGVTKKKGGENGGRPEARVKEEERREEHSRESLEKIRYIQQNLKIEAELSRTPLSTDSTHSAISKQDPLSTDDLMETEGGGRGDVLQQILQQSGIGQK